MDGSFTSGGKRVRAEMYVPADTGAHPAVIVLHGSGGMRYSAGKYQLLAAGLAAAGYVGVVLHYFDRTGNQWADHSNYATHFDGWMATIRDCVSFLANHERVDSAQIGLMGFSLGGYLAVAVAAHEPRVKAVVEFFGGIPELVAEQLRGAKIAHPFPPTLILHGDADLTVPVAEAHKLADVLEDVSVPHEIKIYKGQGHIFTGPDAADAIARAAAFLNTHLRGASDAE